MSRRLGPLRADPRRFRQMPINLPSNAVQFTEAPGSVVVEGRATPDGWLALPVADTGLGLPPVARMARLHGGRLSVESSPGTGTTATIWFPLDCRCDPPAAFRQGAGAAGADR